LDRIGVVAIGRNEGERLVRCLDSVIGQARYVVYVDSGSTDGSVEAARSRGVEVVELDASRPFNMARGRNAGFERLIELRPELEFVQFIDGDCEMVEGWLEFAHRGLLENGSAALVCGRRRERFRDATVYNRLCDMDWDGHPGEVDAAGGDVVMRVSAFDSVGGYDETLLGGEDPDICIRLRQRGGKIVRIDADMTLHDAAMTRFGQWWRRTLRTGRDCAELAHRHRELPEPRLQARARSNWAWGLGLPAAALVLASPTGGASLLVLAGLNGLWIAQVAVRRRRAFGNTWPDSWLFAAKCMLAKFPQMVGQVVYGWIRVGGRLGRRIEYK
jgi:glycosyltransferase involved in cell wall biosynthesis